MDTIDQDNLIRQKTFLLVVPLFAFAALIWTCVYYYFGAKISAIIPGCYALISFSSFLIFRWYKNFNVFRTIQLALILLLPTLLHLSLGNFVSSSAVILWATLCPLGALAFQNTRAAGYWLLLFIVCVITVFILENKFVVNESRLPQQLVAILFVLNISCASSLIFFVMRYFVNQNELVKEKLKLEQEKSEKLLLNILPSPIAQRLKDGE